MIINKHLTSLQIAALNEWDGETVFSLIPGSGGGYYKQTMESFHDHEHDSNEYRRAMNVLDELDVPICDEPTGVVYNIRGRIKHLYDQNRILNKEYEYHIKELLEFVTPKI